MNLLKLVVLIVFVVGFNTQVFDILKQYLKYPTVQKIEFVNQEKIQFPAFTFCDSNYKNLLRFAITANCKRNHEVDTTCNLTLEDILFTKKDRFFCSSIFTRLSSQDTVSHYSIKVPSLQHI